MADARLKRAPERELPPSATRAPIDWEKYGNLPESTNIEDRRGEVLNSIIQQFLAPTGFNSSEWKTMIQNPFTPIQESMPHRRPLPFDVE